MTEHDNTKKNTVELRKSTLFIAGFVIVAALVLAFTLNGGSTSKQGIEGDVTGNSGQVKDTGDSGVLSEGDPVLGDKNAPVSVVEFSDFECPYCKRAYGSTLQGLKDSEMFKNGEVNLVYKHFPLSRIHPDAQKAAEASECANRQGMFWEYHDKLFENQNSLGVSSLKQYAEEVGLDTNEFNSCLENGEAKSKVSSDMQTGRDNGARGTPYFVIVNKETGQTQTVSGAVPWNQLKPSIQQVL